MAVRISVKVPNRWNLETVDEGYESVKKGVILHAALSFAKTINDLLDAESLVFKAIALVGEGFDIYDDLVFHLKNVSKIKNIEKVFPEKYIKVYIEREFTDGNGRVVRPDRVIMYEEGLVVVDYKFGAMADIGEIKARYRFQVMDYCKLLQSIFGLKAEGYILYITLPELIKVFP